MRFDAVAAAVADRLEIGAGAERAAGAGEHGDVLAVVVVELAEGGGQRRCGVPVDGVAHLRAVDGDDDHVAVVVDAHRHRSAPVRRRDVTR